MKRWECGLHKSDLTPAERQAITDDANSRFAGWTPEEFVRLIRAHEQQAIALEGIITGMITELRGNRER